MRAALALARRGLGQVWPNPAVGCILVRDGHVVGRGWTAPGGRPHAETIALERAGAKAKGATVYVSLEPCSHQGQTPPCADALIAAKVARVVASIQDPDPRVSGSGFARLREAGIEVDVGIGAESAAEINAGFLKRLSEGRPIVTLKLATSLDGAIATRKGESQWITGETARAASHLLRATSDAILVGSQTAISDNPELTCRLPGLEGRSPLRLVVDGRLRIDLTSKLVTSARRVPTWILTRAGNDPARISILLSAGVEVIELPDGEDVGVDLPAALQELGKRGLTRILVEGGARLASSLLRHDLVDRLAWFRAPMVLGGDAIPAVISLGLDQLKLAPRFRRLAVTEWGADFYEYLTRE